jgi:hypothetical protein
MGNAAAEYTAGAVGLCVLARVGENSARRPEQRRLVILLCVISKTLASRRVPGFWRAARYCSHRGLPALAAPLPHLLVPLAGGLFCDEALRDGANSVASAREKMTNGYGLVGLVVAFSVLSAVATASEASVRAACKADANKYCGSVIEQTDARRTCMAENKSRLSKRCKVAIRKDHMEHMPRRPR